MEPTCKIQPEAVRFQIVNKLPVWRLEVSLTPVELTFKNNFANSHDDFPFSLVQNGCCCCCCFLLTTFRTLCAPTTAANPACSQLNEQGGSNENISWGAHIDTQSPSRLFNQQYFPVRSYWVGCEIPHRNRKNKVEKEKPRNRDKKQTTNSSFVGTLGGSTLLGHVRR